MTDGQINRWTDGQINRWTDGQINRWANGYIDCLFICPSVYLSVRGRRKDRKKGGRDKYSFTNVWILERQINIQTERRKKEVTILRRPTDKQNCEFIL